MDFEMPGMFKSKVNALSVSCAMYAAYCKHTHLVRSHLYMRIYLRPSVMNGPDAAKRMRDLGCTA